ncbi:ATP-binding protein [Streptacidiphilus sp. 4-A2]|nr:ATP-binding protein [Streptacidiphilus sp. 4-A2]
MPVPPSEEVRYRRFRPAVRAARAAARDLAHRWALDELADDLESVIGELVANAVIHGHATRGSQVAITYRPIRRGLRVEVRDWATGTPLARELTDPATDFAESGRGLAMVDALSHRWGVIPRVIGKSVWCELKRSRRSVQISPEAKATHMCDSKVDEASDLPGFPLPDPVAADGCTACAAHAESIHTARHQGDRSAITDQRVLMRRHIDAEHP